MTSVTVILVGPEQAANVGFVARTMACYGLDGLRIVGSPGIALDGAARKTGKAALPILEAACYFASLEEAIRDCTMAFGFTRRIRAPAQRIDDLSRAAAVWRAQPNAQQGSTALVFGRESQGLFREETLLVSHLARIPTPSESISLNVSHALAIVLHAFLGDVGLAEENAFSPTGESPNPGADGFPTRGEASRTLQSLLEALEKGGFFKGGKEEAQKEYVRILWQRLAPDRRELDFLAGMLRNLGKAR
jgi:tRNA/rRNA methyltransferase